MAFLLPLLFGSVAAAVIFINSTKNDIIPDDIPDDIPDQDIDMAITQVLGPGSPPMQPTPVAFSYTPPPSEYGIGYDQYGNWNPDLLP